MTIKKYVKKNGDESVYDYNQSMYSKKYYEKNKEALTQCTNCDCGGKYKRYNKSHHLRTKKHLKFIEQV